MAAAKKGADLAIVFGEPKGKGGDEPPESDGMVEDDSGEAGPAELAALADFEAAEDPQEKANALKRFVEACVEGGY